MVNSEDLNKIEPHRRNFMSEGSQIRGKLKYKYYANPEPS
jgi:hypothetical protein